MGSCTLTTQLHSYIGAATRTPTTDAPQTSLAPTKFTTLDPGNCTDGNVTHEPDAYKVYYVQPMQCSATL